MIAFSGFAYSQGLSEDLIGILLAIAALSGIIGTFLYPWVRKRIGLQRTGLYALAAELSSLSLCVVSIFCPGSPFDPLYFSTDRNVEIMTFNVTESPTSMLNSTTSTSFQNSSSISPVTSDPYVSSYVSISLLFTGIIGARIGTFKPYCTFFTMLKATLYIGINDVLK